MLHSTQQPTYSNKLGSHESSLQQEEEQESTSSSPQLSVPPAFPSSTSQCRAVKAVTPATVIAWLREHYKLGKHGYSKKAAVFAHYQALCAERGADSSISSTFFGKLVKRAFPEIKTIRKGPRGKVEQCYDRLKPIDPAKASRARWLERVNLYLAALQTSAQQQQPPAVSQAAPALAPAAAQPNHHHHRRRHQQQHQQLHQLPPRASHPIHHAQQSHHYAQEGGAGVGPHHHYASGLDGGGHFLASLLPSFDSPSPSSSFASSPAPSSPAAELAQTTMPPHHHHHQYRGYESFEPVQPAGTYDVAPHQDNTSWRQPQRSAYVSAATMGYHHRHQETDLVAAGPYTTLPPAEEPSPLYHHHDHASFALYL